MFRTAHPSRRLAVALALLLPWPALAAPSPRSYLFVPIVDSSSLGATPTGGALNDRGQVVFTARLPTGESALFLWDGGEVRLLARTEAGGSFLFPDLNNRGEVVTAVSHPFQNLVFVRLREGEVVERLEEGGPLFKFLLCCPLLNERGDMTIFGVLADGPGGIFTLDRGRLTTIAEEGGAFTFVGPVGGINNRGQVAFTGDPDDLERAAVVLGDGHRLTVVADASGPFEFFTDPVVNDRGQVAFVGYPDGSTSPRLVFWDGRRLRVIADADGPYESFFGRPLLTNAGLAVFTARLDDGGIGVFTGPDPVADRILAPGDPLAGSVVVRASALDVDHAGRILILAELADGRTGLWLALPRGRAR